MVISPALGDYIMKEYGENLVVALATAIAVLDVFFILVAVPESLPEKARPPAPISWEQADPFAYLGKVNNFLRYVIYKKNLYLNLYLKSFQIMKNHFK